MEKQKKAKQSPKKFWEKAFIFTVILTILTSAIALATFLQYEGNAPRSERWPVITSEEKVNTSSVLPNNYTIIEIINWTKAQDVITSNIEFGSYNLSIVYFSANDNLTAYLINSKDYFTLNSTKDISYVENSTLKIFENEKERRNLTITMKIENRKQDMYYMVFVNKNNLTINFGIKIDTPKVSVETNKIDIDKYSRENQYIKLISDISVIALIFFFFATVYCAYRWLRENI